MRSQAKTMALASVFLAAPSLTHAAPVVWDFTAPLGDLGVSHVYSPTVAAAGNITATAFGPGNPHLFGKNDGTPDEVGLGLTNDPTGQHEITNQSFIQLDLVNLHVPPLDTTHLSFQSNSTQPGESWKLYGSNVAGSLGTLLLTGFNDNLVADIGPVVGTYRFLDVTALSANVLLREVDSSIPAPEPRTLFLLGTALLGLGFLRAKQA